MSEDRDFRVKSGRIRGTSPKRVRSFVGRVLASTEKAGGTYRNHSRRPTATNFGRGRSAILAAQRSPLGRNRGAVVNV